MTKPLSLPTFFRKILEARATATEAKAKQEALDGQLTEARTQLERLRFEHNYTMGMIQGFTISAGPTPEAQCCRAYLEMQATEHLLRKAKQARQQAETWVGDALVACRGGQRRSRRRLAPR